MTRNKNSQNPTNLNPNKLPNKQGPTKDLKKPQRLNNNNKKGPDILGHDA